MSMTTMEEKIRFREATQEDIQLIHQWLDAPHVAAVWDENPESSLTRRDLAKFVEKSHYQFIHWLALVSGEPFAYIMEGRTASGVEHYKPYVGSEGITASLDFCIGEEKYLGKGLSYRTLEKFIKEMPPEIKTVLIDPNERNHKAIHVYERAGFKKVGSYIETSGLSKGKKMIMMRINR